MTTIVPKIGVTIKNDSGKTIPPSSVVVITFVELTTGSDFVDPELIHHVTQYSCGQSGNVMVTGKTSIVKGAIGRAYHDPFINVAFDAGSGTPLPGDQWGPIEGAWTITKGGKGFFAQGYPAGSAVSTTLFLRNYTRAPAVKCSSSSSSSSTSSSSGSSGSSSGSMSGSSGSSTTSCGCITVVTGISCGSGGLSVTYGQAQGCC